MFVADWCQFCKQVKPEVFELAKKYYKNGNIEIFEDSDDKTKQLMQHYNLGGYPAFIVVDQNGAQVSSYMGDRTYKSILQFYVSNTGTEVVEEDKKYV